MNSNWIGSCTQLCYHPRTTCVEKNWNNGSNCHGELEKNWSVDKFEMKPAMDSTKRTGFATRGYFFFRFLSRWDTKGMAATWLTNLTADLAAVWLSPFWIRCQFLENWYWHQHFFIKSAASALFHRAIMKSRLQNV